MTRLLAITVLCVACPAILAAPPTESEVRQWIRDLEDTRFRVRVTASIRLGELNSHAIPLLKEPALNGDLETSERTLKILGELADSKEKTTEAAARDVLREIAAGDSARANTARSILGKRRHECIRKMEEAGAVLQGEEGRVRRIYLDGVSVTEMGNLLPMLAEFPEAEYFSASTKAFDDRSAKSLASLPNLRDLNLFESSIGDEALKTIATLKKLRRLPMGKTKVTDEGLKRLSGLKEMDYIGVRGTAITDAGVKHLTCHTKLTGLHLAETAVTDAGVAELKAFPNLQMLYLNDTAITDRSIEALEKLADLEWVTLMKTQTTFEGRTKLREALKNVRVADEEKDYP